MTIDAWGFFWMVLYLVGIVWLAVVARKEDSKQPRVTRSLKDFYRSSRRRLRPVVLIFTFSATLFSAFFMVGLPGFIYAHGLATWAWVIFGDVVGMVGLYFVAMRMMQKLIMRDGEILSPLEILCPDRLSRVLFVGLTTIFMLPYLAVQISGFGKLIQSATDSRVSMVMASAAGLAIIYLYSLYAGIRGIAFSDLLQGSILLVCIVVLGAAIAADHGGPLGLLKSVQSQRPELLAMPGPSGLMSGWFLFTGFCIFAALPVTQPQFLTRYLLVDETDLAKAARYFRSVALGMGGLIAVGGLFVVPIALTGSLNFTGLSSGDDLLGTVLRSMAPSWFGGLFTVGVLAAAMSTADSILFSLGQVFSVDVYKGVIAPNATDRQMKVVSRIFISLVALSALVVGLANSELIVALSRRSFEGTLLLLPTVIFGLWGKHIKKFAASVSIVVSASLYWALIPMLTTLTPGLSPAIPAVLVGTLPFVVWRERPGEDSTS